MKHFTRTPNRIYKSMSSLSCAGLKIALAVVSQTIGRGRQKARLSLSLLQTMTGLSKSAVQSGIVNAKQLVKRERVGRDYWYWIDAPECELVENPERPAADSPQVESSPSPCSPRPRYRKSAPLKENVQENGGLEEMLITISSAAAESGETPLENVGWLARRAATLGMGDGDLWCLWISCRKARRPLGLLLWALQGDGRVMRGSGKGKRAGGAYTRSRAHAEFFQEMRA